MIIDIIIVFLLEIFGKIGFINTTIIPCPSKILLESDILDIIMSLKNTIGIILIIFILSILIDMLIIILCYSLECKYIENLLLRLNTIPRIVVTLVSIAILGVGYKTIIVMAVISSMPNFVITILGYLKDKNNKSVIEAAKDSGSNDYEILLGVLIPSNIRGILISMKILLSNIINSVIIGEYLIGTTGLGSILQYNLSMYNMKNVWMIVLITLIFSILVNKIFDLILNNKSFWFNK